jgi:diguanylate cyclase (GGDEF)-like protein/PAS domain S-box-containing protein
MSAVATSETVAVAVAAAVTTVILWRGSARHAPAVRNAFRWLALAALVWGAGRVAQRTGHGALDWTAAPLGFGDLLSLLAVPAMVAGLVTLASARRETAPGPAAPLRPGDALARLADGYVLAAGLFVVGWVTLFGSFYQRSGDGAGAFAVALIHPLADLAALGIVLPFAVSAGRRGLPPFLALLAIATSDALAVGARVGAAIPGTWAQLAAVSAFGLLACVPLAGRGHLRLTRRSPMRGMTALARRGQPQEAAGLVTLAAVLAAALAAVVIIAAALAGGTLTAPVVALAGGSAVLALAIRIAGLLVRDRAAAAGRQEAGRQFRELADRVADVVLVCDLDGRIQYASPAIARYGYAPGGLDGVALADLVHPEDLASSTRAVQAAVSGGPPDGPGGPPEGGPPESRLPCRVRSSDGTWRHVESTVSRYHDAGGPDQLLVTARDVSDQVALRRQVTHLTFHDGLTGLPNRAYLEERAKNLVAAQAAQGGQRGASGAIFLDLDGFTAVNDSIGHGAGDLLLTQAARRLRAAVPPQITVARWGGDEFALLVENAASTGEIVDIAERLTVAIAEASFPVADREVSLTASVGVALAEDGGYGDLLRNADVAMSRVKESGGGHVEVFAAHMHADVVRRLELASDLRRAITAQELQLEYQPVVDLGTARVLGVEALVRWTRAGEAVPPEEFLEVAEESGLIVELGHWVLREACQQAAAWDRAGRTISMSVNFSLRQLSAVRFTESVMAVLEDSGLAPGSLTLEIAERVLIEGAGPMVEGLAELRRRGIRLAIDDFGTGYASLAYLRQLPVDIIKIDPSFVAGLGLDPTLAMLTRTIVRVGHDLGIEVVAEGIERPEQLGLLREMGCGLGQGYLIARPMSAREVESLPGSEPAGPPPAGPGPGPAAAPPGGAGLAGTGPARNVQAGRGQAGRDQPAPVGPVPLAP